MAIVVAGPNSGTSLLLASTIRTATNTTQVVSPIWAKGAIICFDATVEDATAIVTMTIETLDGEGNYTAAYWTAAATITATGDYSYVFYPGVTAADIDATEEMSAPIPREWQLTLTHTDADAFTYSVLVQWLP